MLPHLLSRLCLLFLLVNVTLATTTSTQSSGGISKTSSWFTSQSNPEIDPISRTRDLLHAFAMRREPRQALMTFLGISRIHFSAACQATSYFAAKLAAHHVQDGLGTSDLQAILKDGCVLANSKYNADPHLHYRFQLRLVAHHAWLVSQHYLTRPTQDLSPTPLPDSKMGYNLFRRMIQYDVLVLFPFLSLPDSVYQKDAVGTSHVPVEWVHRALSESATDLGTTLETYEVLWKTLLVPKEFGQELQDKYSAKGGNRGKDYNDFYKGKTSLLLEKYPQGWVARMEAIWKLMLAASGKGVHFPLRQDKAILDEKSSGLWIWLTKGIHKRFKKFHSNAVNVCMHGKYNGKTGSPDIFLGHGHLGPREATGEITLWKEWWAKEIKSLEEDLTLIAMPVFNLLTLLTHRPSREKKGKDLLGERAPDSSYPHLESAKWNDVLNKVDDLTKSVHQRLYPTSVLEDKSLIHHAIWNLPRILASAILNPTGKAIKGSEEISPDSQILKEANRYSIFPLASLAANMHGLQALESSLKVGESISPKEAARWTRMAVSEARTMGRMLQEYAQAPTLFKSTIKAFVQAEESLKTSSDSNSGRRQSMNILKGDLKEKIEIFLTHAKKVKL
ncbi:hypothetical protein BJ684DRAFT_18748 [Piptocephalis cylindrospora]|uniref:Uncharacterized protein n=1 Tax=Piptocephalis cylindrospora TaxID=1907219 RepID=A0A4P9YA00_9FUNG|nr:hypothetical protein BJ684DRAFT_18748 [Piptocephalis cylindrospora]|eukprot:RKP14870.1 hypothetical protein BJ684DRAFT_18748 [Piptocephalis cylindrospora]